MKEQQQISISCILQWAFSNNIAEMLKKLGAEIVLLDYNASGFQEIKNESLEEAKLSN